MEELQQWLCQDLEQRWKKFVWRDWMDVYSQRVWDFLSKWKMFPFQLTFLIHKTIRSLRKGKIYFRKLVRCFLKTQQMPICHIVLLYPKNQGFPNSVLLSVVLFSSTCQSFRGQGQIGLECCQATKDLMKNYD